MKSLQLYRLCKQTSPIFLYQEIHTNRVLLARGARKVPQIHRYEPGTRHRDSISEEDPTSQTLLEESEDDVGAEDFDFMNADQAFDEDLREQRKRREKLGRIITYKKFFAPGPQPPMLTYQERECIRYLHKQDPVQWDVKTLSESFPATPDVVTKILRAKWKITPEKAKVIDSKVQKNWQLLAEGKLNADPDVIEHLKKFVNRREVLLEQIKNENFYSPEVKKEPVWNNGEFNGILRKYENQIKQLVEAAKQHQQPKQLESGMSEEESSIIKENSKDLLYKKIEKIACRRETEEKDSFMFGKMLNHYKKEKTLDELESEILMKAEKRKKLGEVDKVILKSKLGEPDHNYDAPESALSPTKELQEKFKQCLDGEEFGKINRHRQRTVPNSVKMKSDYLPEEEDPIGGDRGHQAREINVRKQGRVKQSSDFDRAEIRKNNREGRYRQEIMASSVKMKSKYAPEEEVEGDLEAVDRTHQGNETNVGKLLNKLYSAEEPAEDVTNNKGKQVKKELKPSDPGRLARENAFYDREVEHIRNTSFWNNGRSSEEKALAERRKPSNDGMAFDARAVNLATTPVFSTDTYPERIKIPKNQRGSGLTFRIKDCYYDDDGAFLYRVPGMTK